MKTAVKELKKKKTPLKEESLARVLQSEPRTSRELEAVLGRL